MQSEPGLARRFSIVIPASVVSDTPHLREKTAKLGAIARASSIFGVNEIILYQDIEHTQADIEFCSEILRYLETPQYLRKRIFKLSPMLKFTGILPPLQVAHHNVPRSLANVKIGDVREGLVISRTSHEIFADIGLEKPVTVPGNYRVGERITVRLITVGEDLHGEPVEPGLMTASRHDRRPMYWGYRVRKVKSLAKLLSTDQWDLRIGTSRYGTPVQELFGSISKDLKTANSTAIFFGSPKMGLRDILAAENLAPTDAFNYFVNTVPDQETMTIRTEEAVFVSLGILNLARKLAG